MRTFGFLSRNELLHRRRAGVLLSNISVGTKNDTYTDLAKHLGLPRVNCADLQGGCRTNYPRAKKGKVTMSDYQCASEDNDPGSSGSGLKNPLLTDGLVIIVRAGAEYPAGTCAEPSTHQYRSAYGGGVYVAARSREGESAGGLILLVDTLPHRHNI